MEISVKAVVRDTAGRVLLGYNPRAEWELLGGRPEPGDAGPADTLVREVREESGLAVVVGPVVDAWYYRPVGTDRRVAVVSYLAALAPDDDGAAVAGEPSTEHRDLRWFPLDDLADVPLPEGYRTTLGRARTMTW